jgi:hypothetical protein
MIAAGVYDFYKYRAPFDRNDLSVLAVGVAAAFAAALLCVRWLLRYCDTRLYLVRLVPDRVLDNCIGDRVLGVDCVVNNVAI